MADYQVDLLAVGAGPANLALAVAIEESGAALDTLLLEQHPDVRWQRNLLLPWARSQVSFLKDLVTLRDPTSRFSFLNFLHSHGRLDEFVNLGTFHPYRSEISDYLRWVADSLERVRVRYNACCEHIAVRRGHDGSVTGWTVSLRGGDTVSCRDLVVGVGRDPYVPPVFGALPAERVVHSTRYSLGIATAASDARVVVIGGAQSAAEMFLAVHEDLPNCTPTIITRSIGFKNYQTSKFVNELYFPSFVDEFFDAPAETRVRILDEMRLTNYAGLAPPFVDELYAMLYQQRLNGRQRSAVLTMTEVVGARVLDGEVALDLLDHRTGARRPMRCDLVLLGTGFDRRMPALVRALDIDDPVVVNRDYRVELDGWGALYLQGVNEATHGISDSLISVLASRSQYIVNDLLARRETYALRSA
jgi:L-ornithine N5-oxygenase